MDHLLAHLLGPSVSFYLAEYRESAAAQRGHQELFAWASRGASLPDARLRLLVVYVHRSSAALAPAVVGQDAQHSTDVATLDGVEELGAKLIEELWWLDVDDDPAVGADGVAVGVDLQREMRDER